MKLKTTLTITTCISIIFTILAVKIYAGCAYPHGEPDCKPETHTCYNSVGPLKKRCPKLGHLDNTVSDQQCNDDYKKFSSTQQLSCTSAMTGFDCNVEDGSCGTMTTGKCKGSTPDACTTEAPFSYSIGGFTYTVASGSAVYYVKQCNQQDGPDVQDVKGGYTAFTSSSDACNPSPTPDPGS